MGKLHDSRLPSVHLTITSFAVGSDMNDAVDKFKEFDDKGAASNVSARSKGPRSSLCVQEHRFLAADCRHGSD
ncbi:hypothetical protein [Glutamicibacter sp.]|uniref:hypothetical protein n=1 Tax=Glutamicibacter sp. TaxID=1931995 RepID=UPI0028BE623A|nr:hypothetical protein [Glutamicibacter sp.]